MRADDEIGRDIWDKHKGNTPQFNPSHAEWYAALTRAAREVLAQERDEATGEAVRDWVKSKINYENKIGPALLAAIRHFAHPARKAPTMLEISDKQVRAAAGHDERRALAASDALFNWMDMPASDQTALFDRVALAIAASDAAAGYVLVPRKATEGMLDAAMKYENIKYPVSHPFYVASREEFRRLFHAMVESTMKEPGDK